MIKLIKFFILPLIGGACYALGFPHKTLPSIFIFPIMGIFLFFCCTSIFNKKKNHLGVELLVWLNFSLGAYLLGYLWIPGTLLEFGDIKWPYNQITGLLFSIIIFPQYLLFLLLYRFIPKLNMKMGLLFNTLSTRNLTLAIILTTIEQLTPQLFPSFIGHSWLSLAPYLGFAPIFGVGFYSFISFLMILVALSYTRTTRLDIKNLLFVILILPLNYFLPLNLTCKINNDQTATNSIRFVQANIGNSLKIEAERMQGYAVQSVEESYKELSLLPSSRDLDLIIWPETAYPHNMFSLDLQKAPIQIPSIFSEVVSSMNAQLLTGGYDLDPTSNGYFASHFNTVFSFTPSKSDVRGVKLENYYHKMELLPFGETLPFGKFNETLSYYLNENISYFATGKRYPLFKTKKETPFITVICYEVLFTSFMRTYLNEVNEPPHFIVNLTNDSWYGNTNEPLQHLFLAKWRALEFQLPILRSTNTGITSILYSDGSESKRISYDKKGILDLDLKTVKQSPTFYQVWGFIPLISLWFFLLFIIGALSIRDKKFERGPSFDHI